MQHYAKSLPHLGNEDETPTKRKNCKSHCRKVKSYKLQTKTQKNESITTNCGNNQISL